MKTYKTIVAVVDSNQSLKADLAFTKDFPELVADELKEAESALLKETSCTQDKHLLLKYRWLRRQQNKIREA